MKNVILAGALVLVSIGSAGAQSLPTDPSSAASTVASRVPAVEACEAQLWRLAGSNKTLAANYNAEHIRDLCLGER